MTSPKLFFLIGLCVVFLFLNSCVPFSDITGKEEKGSKGPLTATTGGKGVTVTFVHGKPPLHELEGTFSIGLKLANYNLEDITIDNFVLGSTLQHPSFPTIEGESVTIEQALTIVVQGKPQFVKPGTEFTYQGSGTKLRDGTIHYGDFLFRNIPIGRGTQFFVEMDMDYKAVSTFQFCAFDVLSQTGFGTGCSAIETISGAGGLGFGYSYDPVIVQSIKKTLVSDRNDVKITLDITLKDNSVNKVNEQGRIAKEEDSQLEFLSFELESTNLGGPTFSCRSDTQRYADNQAFLDLHLRNGKAEITCISYTPLLEERIDYQYQITLYYPYHQRISTPYIPIRPDQQRGFTDFT